MSLGQAWRQDLFRASAAALLAPGAVLAALVVLALGGGFGALTSLGEAFAGPNLPSFANSSRVGGGVGPRARHVSPVLVALGAPASSSASPQASSQAGA